jgi:hypothetical protein
MPPGAVKSVDWILPAAVSSRPSQGARNAHRGTQKIKKRPPGFKRKAENFRREAPGGKVTAKAKTWATPQSEK